VLESIFSDTFVFLYLYICFMNILLIGSGGREHALAEHIARSPLCTTLMIAPGNGGTTEWNVSLDIHKYKKVIEFCESQNIQLVIVGPEQPLIEGFADALREAGIAVLGPGKAGARLEGSKAFAKEFMLKYNIPTASAQSFKREHAREAQSLVLQNPLPVVIKADGLAAGKGVTVAHSHEEAQKALDEIFKKNRFGSAGDRVLIESFLEGKELSVFVLTDGQNYILLPEAMDYKRAREGDAGPNTGGMGAVSPVPFATPALMQFIRRKIIEPTLAGLRNEKIEYRGFVFIGLMVQGDEASVIEYNVRMGDPETEVVIPRILSDMVPYFFGAANGRLPESSLSISLQSALTTVCVSKGYPDSYETEKLITLPENLNESIRLYHAGTRETSDGYLTSGGRVIAVTALAENQESARNLSQQCADEIIFENKYYRKDIGV